MCVCVCVCVCACVRVVPEDGAGGEGGLWWGASEVRGEG